MSLRKEVPKDVLRTVQQASTKRKISWLVRVKAVLVVGGIGCGGGVAAGVLGVFFMHPKESRDPKLPL
jgi:hypothetical protein